MSSNTDQKAEDSIENEVEEAIDSQINHADQITYWESQSSDVNGMLGGYPQVSRIDLRGSKNFITKIRRLTSRDEPESTNGKASADSTPSKQLRRVVDCGAGIGRITTGLLLNVADTVDIVEPVKKFTDVLRDLEPTAGQGKVGGIFVCGLENWSPAEDKSYDIVWIQWCLGHLNDQQAVDLLVRAGKSLRRNDSGYEGWILVKENLSTDVNGEDLFDELDSSVTRSDQKFKDIFERANMKVLKMELQSGFPKDLYPVKMYALTPR